MGAVLSDVIAITALLGVGILAAIAAAKAKDDPEQARILAGIAAAVAFATIILLLVLLPLAILV